MNIPITICITVIPPLPYPPPLSSPPNSSLPTPPLPSLSPPRPLPTLSPHPPSVPSPPSLPHPPFPSLPSLQQIHCPFQPKQSPSNNSHICQEKTYNLWVRWVSLWSVDRTQIPGKLALMEDTWCNANHCCQHVLVIVLRKRHSFWLYKITCFEGNVWWKLAWKFSYTTSRLGQKSCSDS